jgi:hypothetical protein
MTDRPLPMTLDASSIDGARLDLSYLVGRDINLFCEQLPGKEMHGRVVSTHDRQLEIEGGSRQDSTDNLVNNQTVILQFPYKGQTVSVRALLRKSAGGRSYFLMEEKLVPLSQRRHRRIELHRSAKLAAVPIQTFARKNLSRLRWMETTTMNFSSGGALLEIPSYLERGVYLLIHVDVKADLLPVLTLAQVRHCYSADSGRFNTGVEFVVKETARKIVPPSTARELPSAALSYSVIDRERLNKVIQGWMPDANIEL